MRYDCHRRLYFFGADKPFRKCADCQNSIRLQGRGLVPKITAALNQNLRVSKIYFLLEDGELSQIKSKENLQDGTAFNKKNSAALHDENLIATAAKYDIVGKIMAETGLTRQTVSEILNGLTQEIFSQFAKNPEEFIFERHKNYKRRKSRRCHCT